jgi:hypothetical protein
MISGSIALNAYAVPRLTRDIDIVIGLGDHQISDIIDVFHNDFYLDPDTVESEVKRKGMFNVIDYKGGLKLILSSENRLNTGNWSFHAAFKQIFLVLKRGL